MLLLSPLLLTLLFLWLIYRNRIFYFSTLPIYFTVSVFLLKVLLSFCYTYFHIRLYDGADTVGYYTDGMIIYQTVFENPLKYLMLTFGPNNLENIPLFISKEVEAMGYWNDSSSYSIVRFYAFSNLISFGNIYAAGVLMAFLSTTGLLFLYKTISIISQNLSESIITKVILFAMPSVMFWSSGAHKEGLIITGLGFFFYTIVALLEQKKYHARYFIILFISGWLVWYVRDFIFYMLIPGLITYAIVKLLKTNKIIVAFTIVYLLFIVAGTMIPFKIKNDKMNFLQAIQLKNSQFKEHTEGNTNIDIPEINSSFTELAVNIPMAFMRVMSAPFLILNVKRFHWIFIFENIAMLLSLFYCFSLFIKRGIDINPVLLWQFLFAVSMIILIGLVVSNIGAIIRYRSIILPFLIFPLFGFVKQSSKASN